MVLCEEPGLSVYPSADHDFAPSEAYPEHNGTVALAPNPVCALLRSLLAESGLDRARHSSLESAGGPYSAWPARGPEPEKANGRAELPGHVTCQRATVQ